MKIRLENISKQYHETLAVDDLTLHIGDGELVSLLGPSGCGKSTTLAMIAGLEMPTSGRVIFDNDIVNDVPAESRDIGMVFQNYALYPHMTVLENIMFPLKMRKISKEQRIEKAMAIARWMQLEDLVNRKPSKLSGGQQQRVAIARALVKEPKILLLDEPLSNLDARLRIELRDEIRQLQKKLKITTIFVTHDQEEAMSISDKILLMDKGVFQQYASPKEMYEKPVNTFVASFLGNPQMNLLPNDDFMDTKAKTTVGIRPEDFVVVPSKGSYQGQITSVQTLGKELYLGIQLHNEKVTACVSWDHRYDVGDTIELDIKKHHLFDAKGKRIDYEEI
ncbi:MAG: ABC transporter ATP-binding protein [Clostridia bacterium]|nr:ABC transporter ATP-binding protein [Clostridia bacterium]